MTIQEVSQRIGKSQSTIRRWVKEGKLNSTMVNGVYNIPESALDGYSNEYPDGGQAEAVVSQLREDVAYLKEQMAKKDEQIENLQRQMQDNQQRSDMVILTLTRQLEQSQRLLEYHQSTWWRRWFRRSRHDEG